jgi:capsular polysaccharide transport system permease protein
MSPAPGCGGRFRRRAAVAGGMTATLPPGLHPVRPKPVSSRFRRLRVLTALVVREMSTRYGRSAGGYFWALAEPLGGIVLLAIVFSLALRSPPLGTSFVLFYATGMIPFSLFRTMSGGVAGAIKTNKGLLTYPVVTPLDAVLAKFVLNFMTIVVVATLLFAGIIGGLDLHVNLDLGAAALAIAMAAVLGLGIGTLNCVLFGFFPTWRNVWKVLNRPLFILSGIFFTFEMVPKAFQAVLWWNPVVHIVGVMRSGFYGTYEAPYVSLPYVFGIGLGTFVIGAYLLRRHGSALIEQ